MPAGISSLPPSSFDYDYKNSPAFTIIQRDHLETSLPILHINHINGDNNNHHHHHHNHSNSIDNNNDKKNNYNNKTNLIQIKNDKNTLFSRKRISKSNDHLVLASLQNNQVNPLKKKQHSKSHDRITDDENRKSRENSAPNNNIINNKLPINLSTENFNDILTAKLREVHDQEIKLELKLNNNNYSNNNSSNASSNNNNNNININTNNNNNNNKKNKLSQKKPFITTVKTGEFLMPPPEVAALLGMAPNGDWIGYDPDEQQQHTNEGLPRSKFRPLVSLTRRPEVRHSSHNARCPTALKATVDFAINGVNSPAVTASTLANEERARRTLCNNRFLSVDTHESQPWIPQATLPKKLEPLKDSVHITNDPGDHPLPFSNIMFDRRVVRGSTLSAANLMDYEQSHAAKQAEARRKQLAKKRLQTQATKSMMMRASSPLPVPGRKHEPVQTELYLEELLEKPPESEVGTQTDYFLDRPSTPPFCPEKTGVDAETQIAPGDLFDFDTEVQPILEVLVGKTIEQAFIEVLEEEELTALREQQRRFRELRAAEKAEQLRLEEKERRLNEEKERRNKAQKEALKVQQETEERVAAAVLLTGYVAELLPRVLDELKMSGFLLDEIKSDVEEGFMPWLVQEVKKEMDVMVDSRQLLEDIIKDILESRAEVYRKQAEEYDGSHQLSSTQTYVDMDDDNNIEGDESGGTEMKDVNFINYESLIMNTSDSIQ